MKFDNGSLVAIVLVETHSKYFYETLQKYKASSDVIETTSSIILVYIFLEFFPFEV